MTSDVVNSGTVKIGSSGTAISRIMKGTVSIVVGTNAAAAETDVTATITGVAAGDSVVLTPLAAAAEAGLAVALVWVSAADQITVRFTNLNAAAALSGSTSNWQYLVVKS